MWQALKCDTILCKKVLEVYNGKNKIILHKEELL